MASLAEKRLAEIRTRPNINVLVRGGRIVHTARQPHPGDYDPDGRWWSGMTPCREQAVGFDWLREATVADLDTRPRCHTCFPTQAQPAGTGEAADG